MYCKSPPEYLIDQSAGQSLDHNYIPRYTFSLVSDTILRFWMINYTRKKYLLSNSKLLLIGQLLESLFCSTAISDNCNHHSRRFAFCPTLTRHDMGGSWSYPTQIRDSNPCSYSLSLTIPFLLWFIAISRSFGVSLPARLLLLGCLQFKGTFVRCQNNSIYCDWALLRPWKETQFRAVVSTAFSKSPWISTIHAADNNGG